MDKLFDNQYFAKLKSGFLQCAPSTGVSQTCLDFLTSAACFYACDVNVGKFKKYNQCSKKVRLGRERKRKRGGLH